MLDALESVYKGGSMSKQLVGYCDPLCVAPGETVRFMVSCYAADSADSSSQPEGYRADIVRLVCGDDSERGAGFEELEVETQVSGDYPAREQPIHPGSYAVVPHATALSRLESLALRAFVWPTTPRQERQVLVSSWSDGAGFELVIDAAGCLELRLGDGRGGRQQLSSGVPLGERRWCAVAATYDGATGRAALWADPMPFSPSGDLGSRRARVERELPPGALRASGADLAFAAGLLSGPDGRAIPRDLYNGKLEAPCLVDRALEGAELEAFAAGGLPASLEGAVVGNWDFARDISGEHIRDLSPNGLHGTTVNLPTRAVTGRSWSGREQCWRHAPEEYAAIHFHDDDLYDAGWEADFELVVPDGMRSGTYAARLRLGDSEDHVVFFVRPPRDAATAEVAFLMPTATYLAYANERLHLAPHSVLSTGAPRTANDAFLLGHPQVGGSLYERHSDGSGVHTSSWLRPVLSLKPRSMMWSFNADTNVTAWLERAGVRYDVITDEDLHAAGAPLLARYRVVITGAHPEYYSTAMLDGVSAYLEAGGRLMYLGGNGFYWRIAFHPTLRGVIEVRRAEDGTRAWIAEPGEYYHAWGGEYGGLWRRLGRPPNRLVGVGFAAQGFGRSSHYRRRPESRDPRAAFIFDGVSGQEVIGDYGSIGGGAAGQEIDRFDTRLGSPRNALVLASSEGHSREMLRTKEEFLSTTLPFDDPRVRADLVFFECPNGGAVFSTGSIAWAASLAHDGYDNDVCRISANVLRRFRDPKPF